MKQDANSYETCVAFADSCDAVAVVRNVKEVLHLASFVVIAIKNWGCLLSVKPAIDLSSVCQAQLMF